MQLVITPDGSLRCIYAEKINLHAFGTLAVTRASHVEPDGRGQWFADLSPVCGPLLGPFSQRSLALSAEQEWLATHWMIRG